MSLYVIFGCAWFWPGPDDDFLAIRCQRDVFGTNRLCWLLHFLPVTSCITLLRSLMNAFLSVNIRGILGHAVHRRALWHGCRGQWLVVELPKKLPEFLLEVWVVIEERRNLKRTRDKNGSNTKEKHNVGQFTSKSAFPKIIELFQSRHFLVLSLKLDFKYKVLISFITKISS